MHGTVVSPWNASSVPVPVAQVADIPHNDAPGQMEGRDIELGRSGGVSSETGSEQPTLPEVELQQSRITGSQAADSLTSATPSNPHQSLEQSVARPPVEPATDEVARGAEAASGPSFEVNRDPSVHARGEDEEKESVQQAPYRLGGSMSGSSPVRSGDWAMNDSDSDLSSSMDGQFKFVAVTEGRKRGVGLPYNIKRVTHVNKDMQWDVEDPESMFQLNRLLGRGSFGEVWDGVHLESKARMAIKIIMHVDDETAEEIRKEVDILKKVSHANIVSFYGVTKPDSKQRLWILMELCPPGSIQDRMRATDALLTEQQIAYVCACTLRALVVLHVGNGIVHRDVKGQNILLTENGDVKLTDFGISKQLEAKRGSVGGAISGESLLLLFLFGFAIRQTRRRLLPCIWTLAVSLSVGVPCVLVCGRSIRMALEALYPLTPLRWALLSS